MDFPVFDLHCDNAYALLGDNLRRCGSMRKNDLHFDLERASAFNGFTQVFSCFTSEEDVVCRGVSPIDLFERQLATIQRELERNSDLIRQAYSKEDILSNHKKGIMSAILSIEGPAGFGYDPELLEDLYLIGFRLTTLGWNDANPLTGSHLTGDGLSDLGREYVRKAQKLGMLIDVSHISDKGFWDIVDMTQKPIIASHSNSRSVWNHSRNITDDMFRAICATGGIVGINLYANFVGEDPDIDMLASHILHFMELDPQGEHIALGGDLDGCDQLPKGFSGVQDYAKIADSLLAKGLSDKNVMNIFWNNAMEVLGSCCM